MQRVKLAALGVYTCNFSIHCILFFYHWKSNFKKCSRTKLEWQDICADKISAKSAQLFCLAKIYIYLKEISFGKKLHTYVNCSNPVVDSSFSFAGDMKVGAHKIKKKISSPCKNDIMKTWKKKKLRIFTLPGGHGELMEKQILYVEKLI